MRPRRPDAAAPRSEVDGRLAAVPRGCHHVHGAGGDERGQRFVFAPDEEPLGRIAHASAGALSRLSLA